MSQPWTVHGPKLMGFEFQNVVNSKGHSWFAILPECAGCRRSHCYAAWCICGCGTVGRSHVRAWQVHRGSSCTALRDPQEEGPHMHMRRCTHLHTAQLAMFYDVLRKHPAYCTLPDLRASRMSSSCPLEALGENLWEPQRTTFLTYCPTLLRLSLFMDDCKLRSWLEVFM